MNPPKTYTEHVGKVLAASLPFAHVMAIALDPQSAYKQGLIRCITSRTGAVDIDGFVDRSVLHKVKQSGAAHFELGERLVIKNESDIIDQLNPAQNDFIGLEDPDIWVDPESNLVHLYFSIPFRSNQSGHFLVHLGHAVGKSLDQLKMTIPTLTASEKIICAKELSIAPVNRNGLRYNLIESAACIGDLWYSTVRVAIAENMGLPWSYGETIFHPGEHKIAWIAGHASPGPLLPRSFIDVGEGKLLGLLNGREASQKIDQELCYGQFRVGLFIYDYEQGQIDWVSPTYLIQDSQAKTITFASQFVETQKGSGTLYAHVDDSFVRAYTLTADSLRTLIP